jgi:phosphoribosylformylglycinamidine synthase subunit PurL
VGTGRVIVGTVSPSRACASAITASWSPTFPTKSLTDDAPLYHRPVGTWKAPVPLDPRRRGSGRAGEDRDYTADLKKLLASAERLLQALGSRAVRHHGADQHRAGPGRRSRRDAHQGHGHAGPRARPGHGARRQRPLGYLDPKLGAMHAVAEAARKVACTGATPVAATNCLNFGNPEKPEIMAQLSAAIDGIAEACTALGTPITGGNVSLYNETRGEGIYPTPVLGIVGILDDVTKAVPAHFQREATPSAALAGSARRGARSQAQGSRSSRCRSASTRFLRFSERISPCPRSRGGRDRRRSARNLPHSALGIAKVVLGGSGAAARARSRRRSRSAHPAGVLWPSASCFAPRATSPTAASLSPWRRPHSQRDRRTVEQDQSLMVHPLFGLFAEPASTVLVTTAPSNVSEIEKLAGEYNFLAARIGTTGGTALKSPSTASPSSPRRSPILRKPWASALEATLHDEVTA